jgi:hypothetical protein
MEWIMAIRVGASPRSEYWRGTAGLNMPGQAFGEVLAVVITR